MGGRVWIHQRWGWLEALASDLCHDSGGGPPVEVSGNEDCVTRWLTGGEFFLTQPVGQSPPEPPTYLRQEPAYRGRAIKRIAQRKKGKRPPPLKTKKEEEEREKQA